MSLKPTDVSATVAYSLDKWRMSHLPWGLWGVAIGLAIILNVTGKGGSGALHAIVYLAALGVVFAGKVSMDIFERSGRPFYIEFTAWVVGAGLLTLVVAAIVGIVGGVVGSSSGPPRMWWTRLVDPPFNVFGWMLLYLGVGWIAYVLWRHRHPERPVVLLTPAGISMHRASWLHDVLIPWSDVTEIADLDAAGAWVPPSLPLPPVAVVSRDFYERHIEPKIGFLAPPGYELTFRPKGEAMMQVLFASTDLAVSAAEFRAPLEARWNAFHDQTPPAPGGMRAPSAATSPAADVTFGRWTRDGSWWQTILFGAPLVALVAVIVHALVGIR